MDVVYLETFLKLDKALRECKSQPRPDGAVFNPSRGEWTNTKVSGSLPAPQSVHATTIIQGKVCANLHKGQIMIWTATKI